MPMAGRSIFILAVGATIVMLGFSASRLNSSAALDVRHSIQVLDDGFSAMGLRSYMSSEVVTESIATPVQAAGVAMALGADASPPSTAPPPAPLGSFAAAEYDGYFLHARPEALPTNDPQYVRRLLKSLLGMAVHLKRTLVLPDALCNCRDANLTQCDGPRAPAPFDCPLREALDVKAWQSTSLVPLKPARFLLPSGGAVLPDVVRCSHLRVLLPDGMDDSEITYALRSYADVRWLEIDTADKAFCGWDARMPGNAKRQADFSAAADALLAVGSAAPVPLHVCTHYRGGTGEVLQFRNLGCAGKHEVLAPRENLPESVRNLPADTDVMVTFATGAVSTMAVNWVETVRRIGVKEVLIGALDEQMMEACTKAKVPCVLIRGGGMQEELKKCGGNMRKCPAIYPLMSVLKVGFYRELLSFGYNVWACDADAVFANDPRAMMRSQPWAHADVAIATDCIDVPGDNRYALLHCDFNTGMVYLRSRPAVIEFTERWRETVANAKEKRIRDQAAFNMMTKVRRPEQLHIDGKRIDRLFTVTNGGDGTIRLGVLPLAQFLNGHTFFVQHSHTLANAAKPISVHMTYQFAEGAKFAYGKRQRLRQAGLWLIDDDSYFNGKYIKLSDAAANLPVEPMGVSVDSREAVKKHLAEARHRTLQLRSMLGIAKATGRAVILPRMLCYCDYMWKEMKNCRVGGAETMRLPFDCPMDHVLDTPRWFDNAFGVEVRESNFLGNPRVPHNVSSSVAKVELQQGAALTDVQIRELLRPHEHAAIIELSEARGTLCGFADSKSHELFRTETESMLSYTREPFCMMEGSNNAPLFSQCCHPRKPGDKFFPCLHGFDKPEVLPACADGTKPGGRWL